MMERFGLRRFDGGSVPLRLPYEICKDLKIDTKYPDGTSFTPSEAWDAIEEATGASGTSIMNHFSAVGGKTSAVDAMLDKLKTAKRTGVKIKEGEFGSPSTPVKPKTEKKETAKKPTEKKETKKPEPKPKPADAGIKPKVEKAYAETKPKEAELPKEEVKPKETKSNIDFSSPMGEAISNAYSNRLFASEKSISAFGEKYFTKDGKVLAENENDGSVRELESTNAVAREIYDKARSLDVGDTITFGNGDKAECTGYDKFTIDGDKNRSAAKATLYMARGRYAGEDGAAKVDNAKDTRLERLARDSKDGIKVSVGDKNFIKDGDKYIIEGKESADEYDNTKYASPREVAKEISEKLNEIENGDIVKFAGMEFEHKDGKFKNKLSPLEISREDIEKNAFNGVRVDIEKKAPPRSGAWDTDSIREFDGKINEKKYTEDRINNAKQFKDGHEADEALRKGTEDFWNNATSSEKEAAWRYTKGNGYYSRQLRDPTGFDTGRFPKATSTEMNALKRVLKSENLDEDTIMFRGSRKGLFSNEFGIEPRLFNEDEETVRRELIGKIGHDNSPLSLGVTKEASMVSDIEMRFYCPKGTQGLYAEPFSAYGKYGEYKLSKYGGEESTYYSGSKGGRHWDGKFKADGFGAEQEFIINGGINMRCRDVTMVVVDGRTKWVVEVDVISQNDYYETRWNKHKDT